MKRICFVVATCAILAGCASTAMEVKPEGVSITTKGSSLFYGMDDLARKSKAELVAVCGEMPRGNSTPSAAAEVTLLDALSKDLKTIKGIVDLFPTNSLEWAGQCP